MNDVIFTYNEEQALSAGMGGFINESGAYVLTITEAELKQSSSSQSRFIEFSGESEDGRKASYLSLCLVKSDGQPNTFGVNMLNAIMGCAGVHQLTQKMLSVSKHVAPEFAGKRVGMVLQKELRTKPDGKDTYGMDIRLPFYPDTRQTIQERKEGKPAETVSRILTTLKDRDNRKQQSTPPAHNDYPPYDDQSPF